MAFGNLLEYGHSNECEISPILLFLRGKKKFYTNFCIEGKTNNILKKGKKKKGGGKKNKTMLHQNGDWGVIFFKFFIIVCNNHIL